jgi:ligand-binding SRPBCC domain-containing protein
LGVNLYQKLMSVIYLETNIRNSAEVCYKLSLNVDLHQISTTKSGEHIVAGFKNGIMKLGDVVTWKAKHFGIWQTLTSKITHENQPLCFIDEMQKGAFKTMKHEHIFIENHYGSTTMKDIFVFESPMGFLGKLFNFLILENYMKAFLTERNQILKQIAESEEWKQFVS